MGLSASQARLLTITSRKSDCEYQSMRYSHQKISLSREMTDISNAYQNSLNQTKLVYDFYGKGDTSTQLSYGLLMNPSALNNYTPTLITDTAGKVVLDGKLAAAARAAGIPQEGLGCLPSDTLRNKFIQGLADNGMITQELSDLIQEVDYNQMAGNGSNGINTKIITDTGNINDIAHLLKDVNVSINDWGGDPQFVCTPQIIDINRWERVNEVSLEKILKGNYMVCIMGQDGAHDFNYPGSLKDAIATGTYWEDLFSSFGQLVDDGSGFVQQALEYAQSKIESMIDGSNYAWYNDHKKKSSSKIDRWIKERGRTYVGLVAEQNKGGGYNSGISINLSSMAKAYITYFAQFMNGLNNTSEYNVDKYLPNCKFVDDFYSFNIVKGTEVSGDGAMMSNFYDTIFNKICQNGWTENSSINDNSYLQQMLQNGNLYLSTLKDDGYYYKENYATDKYIREITDDDLIAKAEAKYENEKQKINQKEQIIDLKMKNLDTEISSLTTEYDTVKNVISKNIEKVFKRYQA